MVKAFNRHAELPRLARQYLKELVYAARGVRHGGGSVGGAGGALFRVGALSALVPRRGGLFRRELMCGPSFTSGLASFTSGSGSLFRGKLMRSPVGVCRLATFPSYTGRFLGGELMSRALGMGRLAALTRDLPLLLRIHARKAR
jgi:hypothetical protein